MTTQSHNINDPTNTGMELTAELAMITLGTQCTRTGNDKAIQTIAHMHKKVFRNNFSLSLYRYHSPSKLKYTHQTTQCNEFDLPRTNIMQLPTIPCPPSNYKPIANTKLYIRRQLIQSNLYDTPSRKTNESKLKKPEPQSNIVSTSVSRMKSKKSQVESLSPINNLRGKFMILSKKSIDEQSDRGASPNAALIPFEQVMAKANRSLLSNIRNESENKNNDFLTQTHTTLIGNSNRPSKLSPASYAKSKEHNKLSPYRKPFIEWTKSPFYNSILNGMSDFNADNSEDVYTKSDMDILLRSYKQIEEKNAHGLHLKLLSTIRLLTNDMCIPEHYDTVSAYQLVPLVDSCVILFKARAKLVELLKLIQEREQLVMVKLTLLINKPHKQLSDPEKMNLCKYVDDLGNLNAQIFNKIEELQTEFEFLDIPFYIKGIV